VRALAGYIMRSRSHAAAVSALFGFLTWLLPPASHLSGAAVGLSVLRHGVAEGLTVLVLASVATGALAWFAFDTVWPAAALVLALWLPVMIGATVLRVTASQGAMVSAFGLLAGGFVVIVNAAVPDIDRMWLEWLERVWKTVFGGSRAPADEAAMKRIASVMTGAVGAGMAASLVLTLFIARWWQALLYNPGGFRSEFQSLRLPRSMLAIAALVLLGALAGGQSSAVRGASADLVLVLVVLYMFQGLAVVHQRAGAWGLGVAWFVVLYVLLLMVPQYVALFLALLGAADGVADFRRLGSIGPRN
jgi:hypothetical protein